MKGPLQVPMKGKSAWVGEGDTAVSKEPDMKTGRRFYFDVAEEVLAKVGARGLEHAVERLSQQIAMRHRYDVEVAVSKLLADEEWARPIIESAIRETTARFMWDMLSGVHVIEEQPHEQG